MTLSDSDLDSLENERPSVKKLILYSALSNTDIIVRKSILMIIYVYSPMFLPIYFHMVMQPVLHFIFHSSYPVHLQSISSIKFLKVSTFYFCKLCNNQSSTLMTNLK